LPCLSAASTGVAMTHDARRFAAIRVAAAAAVCAIVVTGAGVAAAASGGTWGTAREMPGTAALDQGLPAEALSVSCASAGNCSAGGTYADVPDSSQAFVASEMNGTWQKAREVAGTLNQGRAAVVNSVSCASAGNCAAGGSYSDGSVSATEQAFVASEVNGTWQKAIEVPGTAGGGAVNSVSCASAGNCAAGGSYRDSSGHEHAFVASEVNGTWHAARELPGTAILSKGLGAEALSLSCASAGNCAAGGWYVDSSNHFQAFVASEVNGTWRAAREVAGTLDQGGGAQVNSVSCASAGNCIAGGFYHHNPTAGAQEAFVASEVNGTWRTAIEVPGLAALNQGEAAVNSVSCAAAGNCAAAGFYSAGSRQQAFVASEVNGTWQKAIEVPGTVALNQGGEAAVNSVSCAAAGNCAAAGYYFDSSRHAQAFVVNERPSH